MTEPSEIHLNLIQRLVALSEKLGAETFQLWDEFESFIEKKLVTPASTSGEVVAPVKDESATPIDPVAVAIVTAAPSDDPEAASVPNDAPAVETTVETPTATTAPIADASVASEPTPAS